MTWENTSTPMVPQQQLGQRAGGDAGRRLPGAGPFENVPGVVEAVLLHAGQVGVARADLGQRRGGRRPGAADISACHLSLRVPLGVLDLDGHRRADRAAVADAADEAQLVDLEALPRPTPEAETATGQLGLDVLDGDRQPGRQPLDDDDQGLPVGFTGGQEAEHAATLLLALSDLR